LGVGGGVGCGYHAWLLVSLALRRMVVWV
jgi:hypothetical protein